MANRARLLTAILSLALFLPSPAASAKKKKKVITGVIAGTVFQRSGFTLKRARVTVTPIPADGSKPPKKQIKHAVTDDRGEFAVRVPGQGLRYNVRVEADGWQAAEREVAVTWDQRVDVSFRLKPEPRGGTSK